MFECGFLPMDQLLQANQIAGKALAVVLSHNRRVVSRAVSRAFGAFKGSCGSGVSFDVADALNGSVIWMSTAA